MTPEQQNAYSDYLILLEREEDLLNTAKLEGELNKAIEMAKKMIKDNFDIKMIQKYTDLPLEKLQEIKKSLDKDDN